MLTQIYYCSMTQTEFSDLGVHEGDIIPALSVPTPGNFLRSLSMYDELLVTLAVDVVINNKTDVVNDDTTSIINAIVSSVQALTPITINEVINRYQENPAIHNGIILDWAFQQDFKSILIEYLDKYPDLKKHIGRLLYSNIKRNDKAHLMKLLIDRYDYDITAENYRLFTQAAMSKNEALCEYLLEEKDSRIPENVFNAFMSFGTKRFQNMWNLLKRYKNRVMLS